MPITEEEVARRFASFQRAKRELVPDKKYSARQAAEVVGVKPGTLSKATYHEKLPTASRRKLTRGNCAIEMEERTIWGRDLIEYARQRWAKAVRSASVRTRTRNPNV